jgi:ABC-type branched-subunit amino acid transport system substrate-binding protein
MMFGVLPVNGTNHHGPKEEKMRNRFVIIVLSFVALAGLVFTPSVFAEKDIPAQILIGEPATISGTHAKAGEQSVGGVEAIVDWVNNTYGGVKLQGKRVPLKYTSRGPPTPPG